MWTFQPELHNFGGGIIFNREGIRSENGIGSAVLFFENLDVNVTKFKRGQLMNFCDSLARFLFLVMGPIWKVQLVLCDSKGEQLRFIAESFYM